MGSECGFDGVQRNACLATVDAIPTGWVYVSDCVQENLSME